MNNEPVYPIEPNPPDEVSVLRAEIERLDKSLDAVERAVSGAVDWGSLEQGPTRSKSVSNV